jgi:hypothetical protein
MSDLQSRFLEAFKQGEKDRDAATEQITKGVARIRAGLEQTGLGLSIEASDYDGLFVRAALRVVRRDLVDNRPGWWAYLVRNTTPTGLSFTVRGGFGRKNDPESLRDTLPDRTVNTVEDALSALEHALERGLYYLGTLKRT